MVADETAIGYDIPRVEVGQTWANGSGGRITVVLIDDTMSEAYDQDGRRMWLDSDRRPSDLMWWRLESPRLERPAAKVGQARELVVKAIDGTDGGDWTPAIQLPDGGERPRPTARPGQRWTDGKYEYALLDEGPPGMFLARRDDAVRVFIAHPQASTAWRYVSGPTEPETEREAVVRVVELEAEYPPVGMTRGEWMRRLMGTAERTSRSFVSHLWLVRSAARLLRKSGGAWEGAVEWVAGR